MALTRLIIAGASGIRMAVQKAVWTAHLGSVTTTARATQERHLAVQIVTLAIVVAVARSTIRRRVKVHQIVTGISTTIQVTVITSHMFVTTMVLVIVEKTLHSVAIAAALAAAVVTTTAHVRQARHMKAVLVTVNQDLTLAVMAVANLVKMQVIVQRIVAQPALALIAAITMASAMRTKIHIAVPTTVRQVLEVVPQISIMITPLAIIAATQSAPMVVAGTRRAALLVAGQLQPARLTSTMITLQGIAVATALVPTAVLGTQPRVVRRGVRLPLAETVFVIQARLSIHVRQIAIRVVAVTLMALVIVVRL
jgi:hypothetical protein